MKREEAIMVLNMVEAYGLADEAKRMAIEALSAQPKRGEWIAEEEYGDLWVCDQCGFASEHKDNFCGFCGADMRGEE